LEAGSAGSNDATTATKTTTTKDRSIKTNNLDLRHREVMRRYYQKGSYPLLYSAQLE
jgi:hypothetical protein